MVKSHAGKYLLSTEDFNILIMHGNLSCRRWYLTKDIKKIQGKLYLLPCSVINKEATELESNENMNDSKR